MKKIVGLITLAAFAVSVPALAKEPGWYAGAGLGLTQFKNEIELTGGNGEAKDDAFGGSLIGGYQVNPYFAWEAEMQFSGEGKDAVTIDGSNDATSKFSYNSIGVGVLGMFPFANRFSVFGRFLATYGSAELKLNGQDDGTPFSTKTTYRKSGYAVGAGAGVQFGPVDLRLRYDYQRVSFDDGDNIDEPTRIGLDALWRF